MKRFKEWLINFWLVIVAIISLIFGFTFGMLCFCTIDITPATEADFKLLQDQRIAFEKDHNLLFNSDCCMFEIEDGLISVTFENDECLLTATYNKDFEAISITKSDKAESLLLTIFGLLFVSISASVLFLVLILFIIAGIGELILKIKFRFCPKTNT